MLKGNVICDTCEHTADHQAEFRPRSNEKVKLEFETQSLSGMLEEHLRDADLDCDLQPAEVASVVATEEFQDDIHDPAFEGVLCHFNEHDMDELRDQPRQEVEPMPKKTRLTRDEYEEDENTFEKMLAEAMKTPKPKTESHEEV